jgi:hypothetical protein
MKTPVTTDTTHGLWFVTSQTRIKPTGSRALQHWCRCACGVERWVTSADIQAGRSTNCGCVRRSKVSTRNHKHGLSNTREHVNWMGMIARCENPKNKRYAKYGGRGIKVCARWRESFEAFITDMGRIPFEGAKIDRIDNDRDYEPGNCRWVTNKENCRNRPKVTMLTMDGATKPLNQWAEERGLKPKTVRQRIRRGATPIQALTA